VSTPLSTTALAALARSDDGYLMLNDPPRASRLALLRTALLALAILASAAVVAVLGFAAYLFTEGYSGGSDPQSVAPLAFPIALLVLVVGGLPAILACAASWVGYLTVARKSRPAPSHAGG
jgi:hypothetical protein